MLLKISSNFISKISCCVLLKTCLLLFDMEGYKNQPNSTVDRIEQMRKSFVRQGKHTVFFRFFILFFCVLNYYRIFTFSF